MIGLPHHSGDSRSFVSSLCALLISCSNFSCSILACSQNRDNKTAIELFRRFCDGIKGFSLELMSLLKRG